VAGPDYKLSLEERGDIFHVVIEGEQDSYDVTMGACTEIAALCKARKVSKLLVEHKVRGRLSTLEIFKMATQLPVLFENVRVAFVIHAATAPDNPEFLQNVAQNRGARGRLFSDAKDAEAWLRSL
jgi:hypothetical protein